MDSVNQKLIIKLKSITTNLPKIIDEAGSMLVRNVRSQARAKFTDSPKYPFIRENSFQRNDVVYYKPDERVVIVDHPAAKRLEYGFPEQTITAKNEPFMTFKGQDGEWVSSKTVTVGETKPLGYAEAAIKETKKDLSKRFKEVING